jgi:enoyl-CoA hydratase
MIGDSPAAVYRGDRRVASLELNRPDQRNALNLDLLRDFHAALDEFEQDDEARVLVISGAGPSFCSGFDLSPTSSSTASTLSDPWSDRARLKNWTDLAIRVWELSRPTIARIHGHCLAGGILFTLCSDLVFISEDCVVGWPRLPMGAGFMDGAISLVVGSRRAKEISLVLGSRITGAEAAQWGLANYAVPASELITATEAFAQRVARTPRNISEIRKASMNRVMAGQGFREALAAGVEWDVIAHADPVVDSYRAAVRAHGMKEVIAAFETSDDPLRTLADRAFEK